MSRGGVLTGAHLQGAILEAAVEWEGKIVAFLTDDMPTEDSLRIYLLDSRLRILDWAKLGAMYSTGAFSALELHPPNCMRFQFFGGTTWELILASTPKLAFPLLSDPRGVCRPWRLHRHLQLRGNPVPGR